MVAYLGLSRLGVFVASEAERVATGTLTAISQHTEGHCQPVQPLPRLKGERDRLSHSLQQYSQQSCSPHPPPPPNRHTHNNTSEHECVCFKLLAGQVSFNKDIATTNLTTTTHTHTTQNNNNKQTHQQNKNKKPRKFDHTSPPFQSLHWLPVPRCILCKIKAISAITKCITRAAPSYLCDRLQLYTPSRTLHPASDTFSLQSPRTTLSSVSSHTFSVFGSSTWNDLLLPLRQKPSSELVQI